MVISSTQFLKPVFKIVFLHDQQHDPPSYNHNWHGKEKHAWQYFSCSFILAFDHEVDLAASVND